LRKPPWPPSASASKTSERLGQQDKDEVTAGEAALRVVGTVLADQAVELVPAEVFHGLFKHGSLVAHGIGSLDGGSVGGRLHRVESMSCSCTSKSCAAADKNRAGQQWHKAGLDGYFLVRQRDRDCFVASLLAMT
jgi:hypothetical protein